MIKRTAAISTIAVIIISTWQYDCRSDKMTAEQFEAYNEEIKTWHERRIVSLKRPNGWLTLAGLYWLETGENNVGADPSNDIVFPAGKAPAIIGTLTLEEGRVNATVRRGVRVLHEGEPVKTIEMISDAEGKPTVLTYGSLSWYIIKRGDRFGVRLRDGESAVLKEFKGIETYPVDSTWRIRARLEPYDPPKKIEIPTAIGTVDIEPSPGALVFKIKDRSYRLDHVGKPGDESFFLVFGDETNGEETYGGGRFLVVDRPDEQGITFIDFNKAYNPPCVFTPYATCPLPPEQNRLSAKITAGEKKYGGGSH